MGNWKRTLAIIWLGQFISLLTSSIVGYAAIFWISIETKSPEVLTYAFLAGNLPQILLGLFAGVFVDRWNRKQVMILSDLFIAVCTLILCGFLVFGNRDLIYIYILFSCRSIGSAFHAPAFQAVTPLLVPEFELTRIQGIYQSIQSLCTILSPAIGAILITILQIEYILLFDAAGAVIACICLMLVIIPSTPRSVFESNLWKEIKECFNVIKTTAGLSGFFVAYTLVTFVIMPIAVLFPFIILNHFNGSSFQMGLIEMIWGIGALFGGMILAVNKIKFNDSIAINITYIILGLYLFLSALLPAHGYIWFACLTILGGAVYSIYNALFMAMIQRNIAADVLGRVFAVFFSLTTLPSMIGILASGPLTQQFGVVSVFMFGGALIVVVGITALLASVKRGIGAK